MPIFFVAPAKAGAHCAACAMHHLDSLMLPSASAGGTVDGFGPSSRRRHDGSRPSPGRRERVSAGTAMAGRVPRTTPAGMPIFFVAPAKAGAHRAADAVHEPDSLMLPSA